MHHFIHQAVKIQNPTFKLLEIGSSNGVNNLTPALTINSITEYPVFRYKGGDANGTNWTTWDYGDTLTLGAGTSPSFNQGSPLFGSNDDSVFMNQGGIYTASDTNFANITTEDMVLEMVISGSIAVTNGGYFGKLDGSSNGWCVQTGGNEKGMRVTLGDADDADSVLLDSANPILPSPGTWIYAIVFIDRSGFGQWYVNGTASGAAKDVSAIGSLSSTAAFAIGARSAIFGALAKANIAYAAMWKRDNWLDTHLQAAVATERASRIFGAYPTAASGAASPTTMTRSATAYMDAYQSSSTRSLYLVGANWLRVCKRKDTNGDDFTGYLSEPQLTNVCLQSEAFGTTPWVKLNSNDLIADGYATPNVRLNTGDGITSDASSNRHGISQQVTLTAVTYTFSVWAKAGAVTWLYLANQTVGGADGYFNLETANQTGTKGSSSDELFQEDYGNGWRRCGLSFTGTAAAHTLVIQAAQADLDTTFTGNGVDPSIYLWGAQCEASALMTSYIPTTTATVIRTADRLDFAYTDNADVLDGSLVCKSLLQAYNVGAGNFGLAGISDGTVSNRINLLINATGDVARVFVVSGNVTQADINGTTDIANNDIITASVNWQTNRVNLFIDGSTEGTPDTSATMPAGTPSQISVGSLLTATGPLSGLISNIKIYPRLGMKI